MALLSVLAVGAILFCCAWRVLVWLSHDPLTAVEKAHWSVRYTGFWIWWQHFNDRGSEAVHRAHLRHGPVVRLGPSEISVNSVKGGLDVIYSFREAMPKTNWYQLANSYGQEPMVAIRDETSHRQRKKIVAQPYSKTALRSNDRWILAQARLAEKLVSTLDRFVDQSVQPDFYDLAFAWSVDSISQFLFGAGANMRLLADVPKARRTRQDYEKQRAYQFLPLPAAVLNSMGYRPEIKWIRDMHQAGEQDVHSVYEHVRQAMTISKPHDQNKKPSLSAKEQAILSSEIQDHTIAGIDTSAAVLTTCAWRLSLPAHQLWQRRLRDELHSAGKPTLAADLERLPVLDAILKEILRLHPVVAGSQPRKTYRAVTLGPSGHEIVVPAGVTVHSQAMSLHRSNIFQNAEKFDPGRWLDSPPELVEEMRRWWWPFGSGSRACTGAQLGLDNLRIAIACLFGSFCTELVEGTTFALTEGVIVMPVDQGGYHLRLSIRR